MMIDEKKIIPKPEPKRMSNMVVRNKENRKYKTFKEQTSGVSMQYAKANIKKSLVEECIWLHYNIVTEKKSYHVKVQVAKHRYIKTYPSLEQARIFRDTILNNKERIYASMV